MLDLFKAFVAWCLIILGWVVVNELAERREIRKNAESKIKDLRSCLSTLEDLVISFHTSTFCYSSAREIARRMKTLGHECSHLERRFLLTDEWQTRIVAVKASSTLENFEAATHECQKHDSLIIAKIEASFQGFQVLLLKEVERITFEREPFLKTIVRVIRGFY